MANVLAELFGDIAAAIREKTGDEGTMKPIEFPDEIRAIVTGGGDSGESGGGSGGESGGESGGSGSTDVREVWLSEGGKFTPEERTHMVTHSLGVIPDIVIIKMNIAFSDVEDTTQNSYLMSMFALSDKLIGNSVNVGSEKIFKGNTFAYNHVVPIFLNSVYEVGLENFPNNYAIVATNNTIKFGNDSGYALSTQYSYSWSAYARRTLEGDTEDLIKYVTFIGENGEELCKVPVVIGDDCADPVANGTIQTPTKASTVDKVFTFSGGWSLTEGGTASSVALKNITADKTVYAVFESTPRIYTIKFYDGDVLLETKQLAYGATPNKIIVSSNSEYVFGGWSPDITMVTGDANYYAVWVKPSIEAVYITDDWDTILRSIEDGSAASKYTLGSYKEIANVATMQLVGFYKDTLADGSGENATTTWIAKAPSGDKHVYSENGNAEWGNSDLRAYLRETLLPSLPENIRNRIKNVTKITDEVVVLGANAFDAVAVTSVENIWIPSCFELCGQQFNSQGIPIFSESGVTYNDYYVYTEFLKHFAGTFLRTAAPAGSKFVFTFTPYNVENSVSSAVLNIAEKRNFCIGFCI